MTAALPEQAYNALKASCERLHMPMTEAIELLVVATGPHLPAIVAAQHAAMAATIADRLTFEAPDAGKRKAGRGIDPPAGL
jgi:hypothetical protein